MDSYVENWSHSSHFNNYTKIFSVIKLDKSTIFCPIFRRDHRDGTAQQLVNIAVAWGAGRCWELKSRNNGTVWHKKSWVLGIDRLGRPRTGRGVVL